MTKNLKPVEQGRVLFPSSLSPPAPTPKKRRHSKITPEIVENIKWLASLPVSYRNIRRHYYPGLSVQSISWIAKFGFIPSKKKLLELSEANSTECKVTDQEATRDLKKEISGYQPSSSAAFNHGLGADTPKQVLCKIIRDNNKAGEVAKFMSFRQDYWTLKKILNPKQFSPRQNRYREIHKQLFESLGFNADSDDDYSFGLYDSVASVGLAVIALAEKESPKAAQRLKLDKLAVAAVAYARPQWKERLETATRTLQCPYCKKERTFYEDRKNGRIICAGRKCGRAIPTDEATKFIKVRVRTIDREYLSLVHRAVSARSRNGDEAPSVEQAAHGPLLTLSQSRNRLGGSSTATGPEPPLTLDDSLEDDEDPSDQTDSEAAEEDEDG